MREGRGVLLAAVVKKPKRGGGHTQLMSKEEKETIKGSRHQGRGVQGRENINSHVRPHTEPKKQRGKDGGRVQKKLKDSRA